MKPMREDFYETPERARWCARCERWDESCVCPEDFDTGTVMNPAKLYAKQESVHQARVAAPVSPTTLAEHQSKAGKGRMKMLNKKQRKELARKAGLASAAARKTAKSQAPKGKWTMIKLEPRTTTLTQDEITSIIQRAGGALSNDDCRSLLYYTMGLLHFANDLEASRQWFFYQLKNHLNAK